MAYTDDMVLTIDKVYTVYMIYTDHMVSAVDMVYTVKMVYTIDIVFTVDKVYTVHMVYAIDMVYTVDMVYSVTCGQGDITKGEEVDPLWERPGCGLKHTVESGCRTRVSRNIVKLTVAHG